MEFSLDNPGFSEAIASGQDAPRSPGSSTSSGLQQRSCAKCPSRMSSIDRDKHLYCIKCRGYECSVELRCDECKDWSKEEMLAHKKVRKSLASKSKGRGKSSTSKSNKKPASSPSTSVPLDLDDRFEAQHERMLRDMDERMELLSSSLLGQIKNLIGFQDSDNNPRLMKESLVGYASDVCGKRFVGGCMRRGSEWWNEGVKMKVEEKKRAFEEWLQCNSVEKYERYREKNVEAKRKVEEAKRMSNFKWGQDFDRSYEENKKKFWKEVRRVKKGGSRTEDTVKDVNGRLLRGNEARKRWAEYFEKLLNVQEDREADIVAVGGVQVPVMGEENEREITIEEVKRALNETKGGKAPGMDGVRVEMLKEGGVTVLEWLVRLFNICFMLSIVPVDWVIACMVPLYKGKGDMYECSNFRGISLLSVVGKVYGRVLINRIRDKTENVIAEVQGGFRRGRGCTDQIFIVRQICEKYLGKGKDVYFAFLDLEKAYDRVDRDAMWNVLRLYGIGGRLLRGVKSFYIGSKACVRVGNEVSEWFPVRAGLRQGCVMSPWLFNLYMDGVVREVNA